jgi:hypothetical protein
MSSTADNENAENEGVEDLSSLQGKYDDPLLSGMF